jgi:WXG100 family type VII secretion target
MSVTPTFGNSAAATQAGISVFEEAISAARSIDSEIETQAGALAQAWTGEAAKMYQSAVLTWREGYQKVVGQLNTMVEALQGTVETVGKNEAQTSDSIQQMMSKLQAGA